MKRRGRAKTQKQNGLNPIYEEKIAELSSDIMHSKGENIFLNEDKAIAIDIMPIIQYILMKKTKLKEDRDVLIEYLKSLENFMVLLRIEKSQDLFNEMLIRVSKNLLLQESSQNSILFRIGDKGSLFYIIIKGSVSVLIPKIIKAQMTPEEYLEHLCFLYQLGEKELLILTADSNKEIYDIDLSDPLHPEIVNLSNKALSSYTNRDINYNSVNEYIGCLIPNTTKENNYYYPYISVWIYHKVVELAKGNTFGENALLSKSALRTATIFINEDTIFGILNEIEFNMTLKTLQMQHKKDCIMFVLSFNLFNELNSEVFSRKFWNNFTDMRLKQGENLFQQYDQRNLVYLCKEGEIELSSKLSVNDIDKLLKQFGNKKHIPERKRELVNKKKNVRIACIKSNIIIGLDDLIDENNRMICSATCLSKKAEVFAVNVEVFHEIIDYAGTHNQYKAMIKEKIDVIVNRLKTFKQVDSFILKKEADSVIKSKLMPVFVNHQTQRVIKERKSILDSYNTTTIPPSISISTQNKLNEMYKRTIDKKKLLYTSLDTKKDLITPKISLGDSNHLGPYYNLRPSLKIKMKYSESKAKEQPKKINKTMCETIIHAKTNRTKEKHSFLLSHRDNVNESSDKSLEQQFIKLKKKIDSNPFNKQLIYSNLTLNPDYTLSTKCGFSNIMDYCIMETKKEPSLKASTIRQHIKINSKFKKQNAIRLLYSSNTELKDFIDRTE